MAHAALIFTTIDGSVDAIGSQSLVPLLAMAKRARVTGLVNEIPVERGSVLADWHIRPAYQFVVDKAVRDSHAQPKRKKNA